MSLLINESDEKDFNLVMKREKDNENSVIFSLSTMSSIGRESKSIIAKKKWIYFTV